MSTNLYNFPFCRWWRVPLRHYYLRINVLGGQIVKKRNLKELQEAYTDLTLVKQ